MRNGGDLDLGEIDLVDPVATPRAPPQRRRWPALVLAAAAVAAVIALTGDDERRDRSTSRPSTAPSSVPSSRPADVHLFQPRGLDEVLLVGAPSGYESTGSLVALDVGDGTIQQRIRDIRLWPGDFEVPMLTVGGRLVWADLTRAYSVPIDLRDEPRVIGAASFVVPARDGDHVWLIEQTPRRATEVASDGAVRQATLALPADAFPVAGVDDGLVVNDNRGAAVLDDATGVAVRRFEDVHIVAAFGSTALTADVAMLDLRTGATRAIERVKGTPELVGRATFSPDGRYVALLTGPGGTRAAGIEVRATVDGSLVQFNRIESSMIVWNTVVWSSASDAIYCLTTDTASSADRVIGIPLRGSAQTVAVLDEQGWYWLAVS